MVPNFMVTLAHVSETNPMAALPIWFIARYAQNFGVTWREPPLAATSVSSSHGRAAPLRGPSSSLGRRFAAAPLLPGCRRSSC